MSTIVRLFAALVLASTLLYAQFPAHVELGEVMPPLGTRLEKIEQLGGAASPDLDGDGIDDFVLAAPISHLGGSYSGSVYVLFGPLSETFGLDPEAQYPTGGLRIDGPDSHDGLGRNLGSVGDVNADGFEDLGMAIDDRSFVIFGGPHLRSLTTIDLAQLDGTLGFQVQTLLPGDNRHVFAPLGDVNGDGPADLFIGLPGKDEPWTNLAFRNDVRSAAVGDIDGDGDEDLVVSEGDWDSIVVLFNAGDGTFPTRSQLTLQESRDLSLLDLDGDGDLDLVAEWEKFITTTLVEGWFAVFLNLGAGSFAPRNDYQVGTSGQGLQVALGDLDGDGDADIAGINFPANVGPPPSPSTDVSTYLNDGTGHFARRQMHRFSIDAKNMALLDADGDMDGDILVSNTAFVGTVSPAVHVFRNDGTGGFLPAGRLPLTSYAESLFVGDLTGDGLEDLLTPYQLFPNSPAGLGTALAETYPRSNTGTGTLVDIDGSGTLDLVMGDSNDGVQVHRNPGGGVFDRHFVYQYGAIRGRPKAGDLDGDGAPDLVVEQRAQVSLAFNRGDGTFGGNLSGRAFVVFGHTGIGTGGSLDLDALGGSAGFTIPGRESYANLGNSASSAGDMNGDGLADFVFSAPFTDGDLGDLYVVYGATNLGSTGVLDLSTLTPATGIHVHGTAPEGFCRSVLGDIDTNGDGLDDLVCGGPNAVVEGMTEAGRVRVIFGSPALLAAGTIDIDSLDGSNGYVVTGEQGTFLGGAIIPVGDLDLDGKEDFAAGATGDDSRGEDKGAVYVLFGDPVTTGGVISVNELRGRYGVALHPSFLRSFVGSLIASGDWNDDGQQDLYIASRALFPGATDIGSVHLLWGYDLPHQRRHDDPTDFRAKDL